MKRVERRGTLDSQNLASQLHAAPPAIHPSGAHQPAPGSHTNGRSSGGSQGSESSVHRTETLPIHGADPAGARLGPTGTDLLSQSSYTRNDRDYDRDSGSPYHPSLRSTERGSTPLGIVTLPGSSANEDDEHHHLHQRPRAMLH